MNTLAEYLAATNDDPFQFFLTCSDEINKPCPMHAFVERDFIRWQRDPSNVPFYVKRHFEREHERAQGLPSGAALPDLFNIGAR